jgi:hypothetical protein
VTSVIYFGRTSFASYIESFQDPGARARFLLLVLCFTFPIASARFSCTVTTGMSRLVPQEHSCRLFYFFLGSRFRWCLNSVAVPYFLRALTVARSRQSIPGRRFCRLLRSFASSAGCLYSISYLQF